MFLCYSKPNFMMNFSLQSPHERCFLPSRSGISFYGGKYLRSFFPTTHNLRIYSRKSINIWNKIEFLFVLDTGAGRVSTYGDDF